MPSVTKWYCEDCDVLWNNLGFALDACPKCSGTNLKKVEEEVPPMHDSNSIDRYLVEAMKQADGYIVSDQKCWRCGEDHYMIWPGRRNESDYTKIAPLLQMPRCPREVWEYATTTVFKTAIEDFLRRLEIKDGHD